MEKDVTGLYLTGNPMKPYTELHRRIGAVRIDQLLASFEETTMGQKAEFSDGQAVTLLGMIDRVQLKSTRNNEQMAYATLEDMYGSVELVIFSRNLDACRPLLKTGQVVVVRGRISVREEEPPRILVTDLHEAPSAAAVPTEPQAPPKKPANPGLYLRLPSLECEQWRHVRKLLRVFEGNLPVYVRLTDSGKLVRTPSDLWISPEAVVLREIERAIGRENVAKIW